MPSVISMTTCAPSTGWFLASTTLPLTCPVCASAGDAHNATPSITVAGANRRINAPTMRTSVNNTAARRGYLQLFL